MAKSIRKNSIMMVLYELLSLFVPLILTPYISRAVGANGIGIYSFTYSIVTYFVISIQLGVKLYGRREIAKVNDDRQNYSAVFWEIMTIQTVMFIFVTVAYVFFLFIYDCSALIKTALIIQYIEILVGYLDISWLYYGLEDFKVILYRNIVVRAFEMVFILTFVHNVDDIIMYVLIMAACNFLGVMFMWPTLRKIISIVRVSWISVRRRIFPMLQLFIPVLSSVLFAMVDKTIIGINLDIESVGYYENAYKVAKIPVVIITALGSVMLPRITKLLADGKKDESEKYISKSMSIVMFISCGISFGICAVSQTFIPVFLGSGFEESIPLLELLSFMIIFIGWGNVLRTQYMLPKGFDKAYTKSVLYASVLNILLSFYLVKSLGTIGVASASLFGEIVICLYTNHILKEELPIKEYVLKSTRYIIIGLIMLILVKRISLILDTLNPITLLFIEIIIGGGLYCFLTLLYEYLTKDYIIAEELNIILRKK